MRDNYQILDDSDQTYPFTFPGCARRIVARAIVQGRMLPYNNTTTRVHEVMGEIPLEWDNLDGFDTDPRDGRITADGYVTRFGGLNQSCTAPGTDCHPIKLIQAFTGRYASRFSLVPGEKGRFFCRRFTRARHLFLQQRCVCRE